MFIVRVFIIENNFEITLGKWIKYIIEYHVLLAHIMVWASIPKYQRLGDLNNRNLFLTILEFENSHYVCGCQLIWLLVRAVFLDYVLMWGGGVEEQWVT